MIAALRVGACLLPLSLLSLACGGGEAPSDGGAQQATATHPESDAPADWARWLKAFAQSPLQGEFEVQWDDEATQQGNFLRLAGDRFRVHLKTSLTRHEPGGTAGQEAVRIDIACDGQELRILLPAVLGAGPTLATLPASRLGTLEEVDPQGQAGQFRPDAFSPWHLLQRVLDYGRAQHFERLPEGGASLQFIIPAGNLARFAKDQEVIATLSLAAESFHPASLMLSGGERRLKVSFSALTALPEGEGSASELLLPRPAEATILPLGALVDAETAASSAANLDELGY